MHWLKSLIKAGDPFKWIACFFVRNQLDLWTSDRIFCFRLHVVGTGHDEPDPVRSGCQCGRVIRRKIGRTKRVELDRLRALRTALLGFQMIGHVRGAIGFDGSGDFNRRTIARTGGSHD